MGGAGHRARDAGRRPPGGRLGHGRPRALLAGERWLGRARPRRVARAAARRPTARRSARSCTRSWRPPRPDVALARPRGLPRRRIVTADGVWGVLGDKTAGEHAARVAGDPRHRIASDDVLIVDGRTVLAGPRSVDLREEAAERLGTVSRWARSDAPPLAGPARGRARRAAAAGVDHAGLGLVDVSRATARRGAVPGAAATPRSTSRAARSRGARALQRAAACALHPSAGLGRRWRLRVRSPGVDSRLTFWAAEKR